MILKISECMNSVRPDAELLRRTELAMRAEAERRHRRRRRIQTLAASLAACVALSAAGYGYYYRVPVTSLYVDINPSLALDISRADRVSGVRYLNEDAAELISADELKGQTTQKALSRIMDAAASAGYLSNTTVISLAAYSSSGDEEKADTLLTSCSDSVEEQYKNAAVYATPVRRELNSEAESDSISPGKLSLIKMVQSLDSSATVAEYRDSSVTGIVDRIVYLASDANTSASDQSKADALSSIGPVAGRLHSEAQSPEDEETETDAETPDSSAEDDAVSQPAVIRPPQTSSQTGASQQGGKRPVSDAQTASGTQPAGQQAAASGTKAPAETAAPSGESEEAPDSPDSSESQDSSNASDASKSSDGSTSALLQPLQPASGQQPAAGASGAAVPAPANKTGSPTSSGQTAGGGAPASPPGTPSA